MSALVIFLLKFYQIIEKKVKITNNETRSKLFCIVYSCLLKFLYWAYHYRKSLKNINLFIYYPQKNINYFCLEFHLDLLEKVDLLTILLHRLVGLHQYEEKIWNEFPNHLKRFVNNGKECSADLRCLILEAVYLVFINNSIAEESLCYSYVYLSSVNNFQRLK